MNEQQLLRAVGDAKPEYLAQSEETKKAAQPWKRWAALAACACLIVGLGAAAFAFVTRGASSGGRSGRRPKRVFGLCGASDAADAPRGSAGAERVAEAHCGLRALRAGDRCGRL